MSQSSRSNAIKALEHRPAPESKGKDSIKGRGAPSVEKNVSHVRAPQKQEALAKTTSHKPQELRRTSRREGQAHLDGVSDGSMPLPSHQRVRPQSGPDMSKDVVQPSIEGNQERDPKLYRNVQQNWRTRNQLGSARFSQGLPSQYHNSMQSGPLQASGSIGGFWRPFPPSNRGVQSSTTSAQFTAAYSQQHPQAPALIPVARLENNLRPRWERERTPPVLEPRPTKEYLAQVAKEPVLLSAPQPLLIIFDLNGTLLYRGSRKNLTSFVPRPGLSDFISWLMDADGKHGHRHRAMIWSSAKPENVGPMVNNLFTAAQVDQLAAVWARDKLGLTAQQYANKVQVYKELSKIWKDPAIAKYYPGYGYPTQGVNGEEVWVEEEGWWDQTNTVLVDDTIKKAMSEPYNLLQIPEFEDREDQKDDNTLAAVRTYIEHLAKYADVSAYMKRSSFPGNSDR